jgi:hypothetical protein
MMHRPSLFQPKRLCRAGVQFAGRVQRGGSINTTSLPLPKRRNARKKRAFCHHRHRSLAVLVTLLSGLHVLLMRAATGGVAVLLARSTAALVLLIVLVTLLTGLDVLLVRATLGVTAVLLSGLAAALVLLVVLVALLTGLHMLFVRTAAGCALILVRHISGS